MPTLLGYSITPNPQPLQASPATGSPLAAQVSLVATNNSKNAVSINWLELSIPVGTAANNLTNATTGFGTNLQAGWQLGSPSQSGGQYTFVFTAPSGGATVQAGQDIIFTISNIPLISQPGSPVLTITEGSNGSPTQNINLTLYPNGFGAISFTATPANINSGDSVVLNWIGPSGATYTLQYVFNDAIVNVPASGSPPLSSAGSYPGQGAPPLALTQTTVFTLTVTQVINNVSFILAPQQTVEVVIPSPQIVSFNSNPAFINMASPPTTVVLQWQTTNVSSVQISNDIGVFTGASAENGSYIIASPTQSTKYILTATGLNGNIINTEYWLRLEEISTCSQNGIRNYSGPVLSQVSINTANAFTTNLVVSQSYPETMDVSLNAAANQNLLFAVATSNTIGFEEIIQLPFSESFSPITIIQMAQMPPYKHMSQNLWSVPTGLPAVVVKFGHSGYSVVWLSESSTVNATDVDSDRWPRSFIGSYNLVFKCINYPAQLSVR